MDLINEGEIRLQKEDFNQKVQALSAALSSNMDAQIASAFQDLLPCFEQLGKIVKEVTE